MSTPYCRYLVFLSAVVALMALARAAHGNPCGAGGFSIVQPFPTNGPEVTRWEISACSLGIFPAPAPAGPGLVIGPTHFRTSPNSPNGLIQVLHDARVAEVFVPYHSNSARFYDITTYSQGMLPLDATECPASKGTLHEHDTVCVEVRDRGLAWKDDTGSRRGEEVVLWGVLQAGNYKYVMEWTFRDDGVIVASVGPTGRNLASKHTIAHSHTITWRLDVDLNGPAGDSVTLGKHVEHGLSSPGSTAVDREILMAEEGDRIWHDLHFNTLNIYDAVLKNAQGHPASYRLIPLRSGTARHSEAFTKSDFWVTRNGGSKSAEMLAKDLPLYVNPAQDVVNADMIVWYTSSLHHMERDEDDNGPTQVSRVSFTLMPFNLFDVSPLYILD